MSKDEKWNPLAERIGKGTRFSLARIMRASSSPEMRLLMRGCGKCAKDGREEANEGLTCVLIELYLLLVNEDCPPAICGAFQIVFIL